MEQLELHPRLGRRVRRAHARTPHPDMSFIETPLPGVWVVELELLEDERGCFARTFDSCAFADRGL